MKCHLPVVRFFSLLTLGLLSAHVAAQSSSSPISYQGLLSQDNNPVPDGEYTLVFRLYATETGGTPLATQSVVGVQSRGGLFNTLVPFESSLFNGQDRWWTVSVSGVELLPRQRVAWSPYSVNARSLGEAVTITAAGSPSSPSAVTTLIAGGANRVGNSDFFAARVLNTGGLGAGLQVEAGFANAGSGVPVLQTKVAATGGPRYPFTVTQGAGVFAPQLTVSGSLPGDAGFISPSSLFNVYGGVNNAYLAWIRNGGGDGGALLLTGTSGDPGGTQPILRAETFDGRLRLEVTEGGTVRVPVLQILGGSDLAEPFPASPTTAEAVKPKAGLILSIDPANPGSLRVATEAYDTKVAGVYSGGNDLPTGMLMGKEGCNLTAPGEDKIPLAMTGRVWVYADESAGTIKPGDRLTTSGLKPGHAMRVSDNARSVGAVIGKAMTGVDPKAGMVLVLVNLQ